MEESYVNLFSELLDCFSIIEKRLTPEELHEIKCSSKEDLYLLHFSLGIWIRNNLLMDHYDLYKLLYNNCIQDRDGMSSLIIRLFHQYLR